MNIVIVTWTFFPMVGGIERQSARHAREYTRRGHKVTVLTGRRSPSWKKTETIDGYRVVRFAPGRHLLTVLRICLWIAARRRSIDVIDGFMLNAPITLVGVLARVLRIPMTVFIGSMGYHSDILQARKLFGGSFFMWIARKLRWAVAASSGPMKDDLVSHGIDPKLIYIYPTPTEVLPEPLPLTDDVVLTPCRYISGVKGLDVAEKAWEIVAREGPPGWKYLVIGPDVPGHVSGEGIEALPAHDRVWEFASGASIFLQPSRMEGLSNSLLEALARGVPAVATDVGGTSSLADAGVILIPPEDPRAMADALLRLMRNPDARVALGRKGREWMLANSDIATMELMAERRQRKEA